VESENEEDLESESDGDTGGNESSWKKNTPVCQRGF
jgi:hypothetical protein